MRSLAFVRNPPCAVSSAIRRPASLTLSDAQKNSLRLLRSGSIRLVRPAHASGTRSAQRRSAGVPAVRDPARAVQELRQREARAARFPGRQPVLHQALRLLRGAALPAGLHQGYRRGVEAGVGHDQDPGDAVHAGATGQGGHAGAQGYRYRRDFDQERATPIASWSAT